MANSTFVARLSRGAVASTIAVGCLVPESHSAIADAPVAAHEIAMPEQTFLRGTAGHSEDGGSISLHMPESPKEWTKQMEREFRQLALGEATRSLSTEQLARLEALSVWRDRMINPRTADEVLLQLKRDRLLEKISDTLRQYVEFQESAHKKRPASG